MSSGYPKQSETLAYYWKYVSLVEGEDIIQVLLQQTDRLAKFYNEVPSEKWAYAYAPGKWTLKGTLRHLIDTERVFTYRMLRFLRNDATVLPGFDQDDYMVQVNLEQTDMEQLLEEWRTVRSGTISFLRSVPPDGWDRSGEASGGWHSVRALAYIIAGHELHHQRLARDKYLL